jgi:ubiquinone/menaquinone biosynthesis C-methylase UbiE
MGTTLPDNAVRPLAWIAVGGIAFDRAVDFYDQTRALPAPVAEAVTEILASELAGKGTALEIGVGTGRMALPLCAREIPLVGVDLSGPMLSRLRANAAGLRIPVALGDATSLPFTDGSFGAVVASHVLHLIPDWRMAVEEALRVTRPGGALLVDVGSIHRGGEPPNPWREPVREILAKHGMSTARTGLTSAEDLVSALGNRARARPLEGVRMTIRRSLAQDLDDWQHQIHSWTWPYSAERIAAACVDVRQWGADHEWPLEQPVERERMVQWWAFDLT